ncbi:PapG carbohydrate binding domain-containing protein [Escherichia coli]|uniref:PapG carbohydrate-binding domain-containing protein n=1 Tax=Escherichia coli TaxID=562 RepID=A0A4Q4IAW0_ECOLX|nr:hypothetical protein EWK56_04255 [Escherichia coli]
MKKWLPAFLFLSLSGCNDVDLPLYFQTPVIT